MQTRLHNTLLATFAGATLLTACSSQPPPTPVVEHENVFVGAEPVYAVLQRRGDGQWTFSQISDVNHDPESGYLVRLNDLSPAFDIRPAECEPRPYRESDRCNPINPFRERNLGVVGKIVDTGISAGTGGKISGVSRSYSTAFDHLAFNAAVDQALLLTGLDDNRIALLNGIGRIDAKSAEQNEQIETLKAQMLQQYEIDKTENIKIDARVSGLIQYYSDDLNPTDFVSVGTGTGTSAAIRNEKQKPKLFPCEASRCLGELVAAESALEQQHAQNLATLQAELQRQTDAYVVDCSATTHGGYHFQLHCPEKLQRNPDGLILLPVDIEILSRDFDHLFPDFATENTDLAAAVRDGRLIIGNRSGDFVDILSVSLYYNSLISTNSDLGARRNLAPYQNASIPLTELTSREIDTESRHTNMTPDKASRSNFGFGIALKYSMRNRDAIETLYGAGDFNVQCAIESRLIPGSCVHEQPQDDSGGDVVSALDQQDEKAAASSVERR
jgi:hypothetical protein